MAKDAFWFPHDSNAAGDRKTVRLVLKLGMEGYGVYWRLIETLRDQPDYAYPLDLLPALAGSCRTTADIIQMVVDDYDLFMYDGNGNFYSESLRERMQAWDSKRERASTGGKSGADKRWHSRPSAKPITTPLLITEEKKIEQNTKQEIDLPDWIDAGTWNEFLGMRKTIKKPATHRAQTLIISKLGKLREQGADPNEVLNQSIVNSWQDVYPLKDGANRLPATEQKLREFEVG